MFFMVAWCHYSDTGSPCIVIKTKSQYGAVLKNWGTGTGKKKAHMYYVMEINICEGRILKKKQKYIIIIRQNTNLKHTLHWLFSY